MSEKSEATQLCITAAKDGGYTVHESHDPKFGVLLFAGALGPCLEYIAKHFGAGGNFQKYQGGLTVASSNDTVRTP